MHAGVRSVHATTPTREKCSVRGIASSSTGTNFRADGGTDACSCPGTNRGSVWVTSLPPRGTKFRTERWPTLLHLCFSVCGRDRRGGTDGASRALSAANFRESVTIVCCVPLVAVKLSSGTHKRSGMRLLKLSRLSSPQKGKVNTSWVCTFCRQEGVRRGCEGDPTGLREGPGVFGLQPFM